MYHQANALASEAVAQRAAAHNVKHFLLVSSVSAVGRAPAGGLLTPGSQMQPVTSYGQSKMTAERLVTETLTGTPTELTILRPPLVYGPHPKGNLRLLIQMLRTGLPLPLADINNQRSMIATPNLIALLTDLACDTRAYDKVLMPSDVTISTTQLVCQLCHALDRKPRLFRLPASVLQTSTRLPVIGPRLGRVLDPLLTSLAIQDSFLRDSLGWQPAIAPDTVLTQMVQSVAHR
jgi:nucleoside-diphosphate-sugar epimerase